MPNPIPTPNEVTMNPQPASSAWRVSTTKIGASARTAPTAENATTIPAVIAEAIESSRRKRIPSSTSRQIREKSSRPVSLAGEGGMGTRLIIAAENRNVVASRNSGTAWRRPSRNGIACARSRFTPISTVNTIPPRGSVPYVDASAIEFAFASWRRGTRLGRDASRAGPQTSERLSIKNDSA
jgi:hypothetical protein